MPQPQNPYVFDPDFLLFSQLYDAGEDRSLSYEGERAFIARATFLIVQRQRQRQLKQRSMWVKTEEKC